MKEESRELFDSLTAFDAIEKERRYRKIKEVKRWVDLASAATNHACTHACRPIER